MKRSTKIIIGAMAMAITTSGAITLGTTFATSSPVTAYALDQYQGHDLIKGTYCNVEYTYSDGLFETDPHYYNKHMATMSMTLTDAGVTYINGKDYSNGAKNVKELYHQIGYEQYFVNEGYVNKPTADSIGFIIANKSFYSSRKKNYVTVVATTIRSANYELEWASNVKLGASGEAEGFREAAEQVKKGIDNYLINNDLMDDKKAGNLIFWINGFSRGGATANLTAKRLVDDYQPEGNDVYAYCLEAPQGGVASEELEHRDYRGIHNIINPNDMVPYVAPSKFGFKRYGVDHYLLDRNYDSDHLQYSKQFPNNIADNEPKAFPEKDHYIAMFKQLSKMIPNRKDKKDKMPYELEYQSLRFPECSIEWIDNGEDLDGFIKRFVDNLASSTTREEYATKGLETAARNFMIYTKSGGDIGSFKSKFGGMDGVMIVKDLIIPVIVENIYTGIKNFIDWAKEVFTDYKAGSYRLSSGFRDRIATALVDRIKTKKDVINTLDKEYPGKAEQAYKDIYNLVYYVLGGMEELDDAITMAYEAEHIFQNHSMKQVLAWLQAEDTWVTK